MNFLEGIQYFGIGLVWNNLECESSLPFLYPRPISELVDEFFPRSDDGFGKCKQNLFMTKTSSSFESAFEVASLI
jgi:hypothetical protein